MMGSGLIIALDEISKTMSANLLEALIPWVRGWFEAAVMIYLLWWLIDNGVLKGELEKRRIIRMFMLITVVEVFMHGSAIYHDFLFPPLKALGTNFTALMISGSNFEGNVNDVKSLMEALDVEMSSIIKSAQSIGEDDWGINIANAFTCLVLTFLFWFLWCFFFSVLVEYTFCWTIFSCLAPLAIALSFFKSTRTIAVSLFRLPIYGAFVMGLSTLTMNFIFTVLRIGTSGAPVNKKGEIAPNASEFVGSLASHEWILALLVGIFMLWKSHGIAGKIANFELSAAPNLGFAAAAASAKIPMAAPGAVSKLRTAMRGS